MIITLPAEDGNLIISWFEDTRELALTFNTGEDIEEIEDQYILDEQTSYTLLKFLEEKFKKAKKTTKVILKTSDKNK